MSTKELDCCAGQKSPEAKKDIERACHSASMPPRRGRTLLKVSYALKLPARQLVLRHTLTQAAHAGHHPGRQRVRLLLPRSMGSVVTQLLASQTLSRDSAFILCGCLQL